MEHGVDALVDALEKLVHAVQVGDLLVADEALQESRGNLSHAMRPEDPLRQPLHTSHSAWSTPWWVWMSLSSHVWISLGWVLGWRIRRPRSSSSRSRLTALTM